MIFKFSKPYLLQSISGNIAFCMILAVLILCVIDKFALVSSCVLVFTFSSSKLIVRFLNWFTLSARASPIVEGKKSSEKAGMD